MTIHLHPEPEYNESLISQLKNCPTYMPIKYKEGGLYDRVLENFKEHKDDEEFPENEEYQWVQVFKDKGNNKIQLARPGKVQEYKNKEYINKWGDRTIHHYVSNIVSLDMYFYKSATTNTVAFTYGDKRNLIKPFKKISHSWKALREYYTNVDKIGLLSRTNRTVPLGKYEFPWLFECRVCGTQGASKIDKATNDIVPENFLTCEEAMVKDILI